LIWQLAGVVGTSPGPLTLRELVWMAEAKRREAWQHTSSLIATLANIHRDPKKKPRPYSANDFQPVPAERSQPAPKADIQVLKQVFVNRD
jgi:hypothetical protein